MAILHNWFQKKSAKQSDAGSSEQTDKVETYEERAKKREQERVRNEDEMNRQVLEEYYASLPKKCGMDETMSISVIQNSGTNHFLFCERQLFSKKDNHIMTSDDLKKYQNQNKALLVTGDAGCGKSTLLRALTIYDVREAKDTIVPFYIPLKSLKKEMEKGMDTLEEYLSGFTFLNCGKDSFYQIIENRKIHLYFDAVDELPAEQREDVLSVVSKFIYEYKENIEKIIISSRNETDINPSNLNMKYDCYELRIFTEEEYELFLKTNMMAEEKAEFTTKIEDFHEEIKNNPYYLTGLITAYKNGKELPMNVYAIMDYMLEELLAREKEKSIESKITNKIRNKLPRLSFEMLCTGAPLSKIYRNISAEEDDVDDELEDMTNRTIISGRTGDFASQKMQEFLAAEYIIKSRKADMLIKSLEELPEKWDNVFLYWISEWELQPDSCEANNVYIDALIRNSQIRDIVLNNIKFLTVKRDALYQRMSDCLVEELLSGDTTNVYATDFFFFVPKYRLYAYVADTISRMKPENPTTKTALYLLRDVCFMYAAVDSVDDIPDITAECRDRLKAICNQLRNEQSGQRHWLTRMFYNYEELCDEEIEIIKGWLPVYPREFCVRHAYSRRNEEYLDREDANSYEDEEGLFQVCNFEQDEYKGLCAMHYDVDAIATVLREKKHNRLSGIILIQSNLETLHMIYFTNKENIFYYSMPDNINGVYSYAFNFMKNVNYIFLPQKVQNTYQNAFASLKTLYLYIENNPSSLDFWVMRDEKNVPPIIIDNAALTPEKMDKHGYGRRLFYICQRLNEVEELRMHGNDMYYIPSGAFEGRIIDDYHIPSKELRSRELRSSNMLKKISLGKSILVLGTNAFRNCNNLESFSAPFLKYKYWNAFSNCTQLKRESVLADCIVVGQNPFRMKSLKEMMDSIRNSDNENNSTNKTELDTEVYDKAFNEYMENNEEEQRQIDEAENQLLKQWANSTKISKSDMDIVPYNLRHKMSFVDKVVPDCIQYIDDYVFKGCFNLALTKLPDKLDAIGNYAFEGCTNIKLDELPNSVKKIGKRAFAGCENLMLTKLPEQLEIIESCAFEGCPNIQLNDLPIGLRVIGDSTFRNSQISAGGGPFTTETSNEFPNINLVELPEQVEIIGNYAFAGCSNIKLNKLPNRVKEVGRDAFYCCPGLVLTELPESLETIANGAFSMCSSIVYIKLASNVKRWGARVFCKCDHLLSVELGETMESISQGMFFGCKKLKEVIFSQSLKKIRKEAFFDCIALDIYKLPEKLVVIEDNAFRNCRNVKTLYFPDTLFYIGRNSFNGCTELYHISIPYDMARIEEGAFINCAEHIIVEIRCHNMDEYHEIMNNLFNDDSVEKIFGESRSPEFVPSLLN